MFHLAPSHQKVAWLDVPMQNLELVQVFYPLECLQTQHYHCLQAQSPPTTHPQCLHVLPQLLQHQIDTSFLLKSLFYFREAMEMRLLQFFVCLYLIVYQFAL